MSRQDKKPPFFQNIKPFIEAHLVFALVLFIVCGLAYYFVPIFLGTAINSKEMLAILIFTSLITVCVCVETTIIILNTLAQNKEYLDTETQKHLSEYKCRSCLYELLDIQKHLYGNDIEDALHELSVEDIEKISLMANALIKDDEIITEDEKEKIQKFCTVLLNAKRAGKYASYITIDDMKKIEDNVDENASIIVVSSSVSCDEALLPIIKNNLNKGVNYKYYFPRNCDTFPGNEEIFNALLDQFNKNLIEWQNDSRINYKTIKKHITCAWFPEEFMQMSFTAYNFHRVGVEGESPQIIVKFPALDLSVSEEYPLFYYVNKENGINRKMCETLNHIAKKATPLSIYKTATGKAQFKYQVK